MRDSWRETFQTAIAVLLLKYLTFEPQLFYVLCHVFKVNGDRSSLKILNLLRTYLNVLKLVDFVTLSRFSFICFFYFCLKYRCWVRALLLSWYNLFRCFWTHIVFVFKLVFNDRVETDAMLGLLLILFVNCLHIIVIHVHRCFSWNE